MPSGHSPLKIFKNAALIDALYTSAAVAEFTAQGIFVDASDAFLKITGYSRNDVINQHHSLLMPLEDKKSPAYTAFWENLRQGHAQTGEFHRIGKNGQDIWLQASYMPVRGAKGRIDRIVKLALDVTQGHQKAVQDAATLRAINHSQAVIRFKPDGTILDANAVFSEVMGYSLEEIKGKHHSMFVDPKFVAGDEYKQFWKRLAAGEFFVASYPRIGKNHRDVWLQASYNPVLDERGNVVEIIKVASDITSTQQIGQALKSLAAGNLCAEITHPLVGSLDEIRVAFNDSTSTMRLALLNILTTAENIRTNSRGLSESANMLSQRAEQQAAGLEETAAALEQITNSVHNLTESTVRMRGVAKQANSEAESSSEVVEDAVQTMAKIDQNAKQISHIIEVIDEIALQTNLLALNAGVEAARAGDAGRGFAVVATEVRALAQRSAEAAKEIKTLINASGKVVTAGVDSVTNAHKSLGLVADYIRTIDQAVGETAVGAKEQSHALSQVNAAMNEIDKVTQANAAMAEETAAASQTLAQEAENISLLLGRFNVGRSSSSPAARSTAPHEFLSAAE